MRLASIPRSSRAVVILFALRCALYAQTPAVSSVEGQVIDAGSGAPVAGASVMVDGVKTTTDSQGKFVLKEAAAGQRIVTISAAGHADTSVAVELASGT